MSFFLTSALVIDFLSLQQSSFFDIVPFLQQSASAFFAAVLEQASLSGELNSFKGETTLFIKPGFKFNCVDAMITNFHLPESTLLMLVCAFGGYENIMRAYNEAVKQKYRFFSYGDAMFIERNKDAV